MSVAKAKRLLKAYWNNIFDGKITTLIGFFMIGMGIHSAVNKAGFAESFAWIGGGLALAGLKDSHVGLKDKDQQPPQIP